MHEEWTEKLSEYLDGELPIGEQAAVDAHLRGCDACAAVLGDLERVVVRAQGLPPRAPEVDLWQGVAARIVKSAAPRRFAFTLPQLAAAAALLVATSATLAIKLMAPPPVASPSGVPSDAAGRLPAGLPAPTQPAPLLPSQAPRADEVQAGLADAQYDAAVADLEKALKDGRGRLDSATIVIVEHNLQIIDQAIAQAREALAADPANGYLNDHLVEARRRKLDLLRRAAALAETD